MSSASDAVGYAWSVFGIAKDYTNGGTEAVARNLVGQALGQVLNPGNALIVGNVLDFALNTDTQAAVAALYRQGQTGTINQSEANQLATVMAEGSSTSGPSFSVSTAKTGEFLLIDYYTAPADAAYNTNHPFIHTQFYIASGTNIGPTNGPYETAYNPDGTVGGAVMTYNYSVIGGVTGISSIPAGARVISSLDPNNGGVSSATDAAFGGVAHSGNVSLFSHSGESSISGDYGSLSVDASGNFSYQKSANTILPTGSHPVDNFTLEFLANNNTPQTLTIALNRAPIAQIDTVVTGQTGAVSADAAHGVLVGDTDADGDALNVSSVGDGTSPLGTPVAGTYGHLTLNADGSYSYAADNTAAIAQATAGTDLKDSFAITVSDGYGGTAASSLTIHVTAGSGAGGSSGGGTSSAEALFGTVTTDPHSVGGQVYALYEGVLGRAPDTLGLEYWVDQLNHGASLATITAGFLASAEGQARLGASDNTGFVEQLYHNTLHRDPDSAGLASWVNQLAHGASRVDVADGFVLSPEFTNTVQQSISGGLFVPDANASEVARLYYTMLGRAPDATGLQHWTDQIEHGGGTAASVAQAFLVSPEGQGTYGGLSNSAYVDALYVNALGRHAESNGLSYWTSQLDHGESRADLAVQLSESAEAQNHHLGNIQQGWHLA